MKTYSNLTREERIKQVMSQRRKDLGLVLENLSEELNISAILRTAEGFGVGFVYIIYKEGGKQPKLSNGISSGASKWLNIKFFTSTKECLEELKSAGFKIVSTEVNPEAKVLWETRLEGKVALVMGNEAQGISEEAINFSDERVYLPMFGLTESLNVSVATALFLYEIIRQKEQSI